jgi:hypothetical protein
MEPEPASFVVDSAAVGAALGVAVDESASATGTQVLRFRVAVGFGTGLVRHVFVDLGARYFRSTLWSAPHRCLEHLEVTDLTAIGCDALNGRLVLDGMGLRLVLSRQGSLTVVPASHPSSRRHAMRVHDGLVPGPGSGYDFGPDRLDTSP